MNIKSYKDLIVWQKAMDLVVMVYQETRKFPKEEMYGLVSQLQRAVVSVPSNIAEGQARQHKKEFIQFLAIARGSLAEVETQLILANRLNYLSKEKLNSLMEVQIEVNKMTTTLMKKLKTLN